MAQGSGLRAQGELAHSQKLLSVIIPAYNTAKFLNKCVDSVVNQTYKNIEIIIVDDGSSDSTPQICDELANKYDNIKIIHQENKGLARTRGAGFNASSGEYIAFVDSDDYIDLNAYAKAIKVLEENDCDMVQFGYYEVMPDGKILNERSSQDLKLYSPREIFKYFITGQTNPAVWNKIYKREIFDGVEWPKINMAEDCCISSQTFAKAQSLVSINQSFYYYVQQEASIVHQPYNKSKRDDIFTACNFVINLTQNKFPEFLPEAILRKLGSIEAVIANYLLSDYSDRREVLRQFTEIYKQDYKLMKAELKRQGRSIALKISLRLKQKIHILLLIHCQTLYKIYLRTRLKIHALTGI